MLYLAHVTSSSSPGPSNFLYAGFFGILTYVKNSVSPVETSDSLRQSRQHSPSFPLQTMDTSALSNPPAA